jgi:predicted transcriptional regulator
MAVSGKDVARQVIDTLPDDASLDDVMYAIYVRMKIERGLRDEEAGNLIDHRDVMRALNTWLRSVGYPMTGS